MRIVIVYLGRRGAGGIISFELACQLVSKHQVLAFLSGFSESLDRWSDEKLSFVEVDTYRDAVGALWSLLFPIKIHRIAVQIRKNNPNILLFPMFHPWNSLIQKTLSNIPSVIFVHDPRPHPDLAGWFYQKLENASIRRATRCVVLSESLRPILVDRGVDPDRIDAVPLGPFIYPPSIQLASHKDRTPTILFFGRIAPYKGLGALLRSYEEVHKSFPCRLLIAGDGSLAPFKDVIDRLQDVTLINRWIADKEIADIFMGSDLVVLPYASASQSGVIPIAAVFGLPVIATRVGGLSEQIEDGISGWLVPPDDTQKLTDTIAMVLSNPQDALQRGLALKERYEKHLGWKQAACRLLDSLEIAMQTRGRNE